MSDSGASSFIRPENEDELPNRRASTESADRPRWLSFMHVLDVDSSARRNGLVPA